MFSPSSAEEMSWAEDDKLTVREREDDYSNVAAREGFFCFMCGRTDITGCWKISSEALGSFRIRNNLPLLFSS